MRAIQGALIVSSSIQIILGYSQLWGIFSRCVSSCFAFQEQIGHVSKMLEQIGACAFRFNLGQCLCSSDVSWVLLSDSSVQWGWRQWLRCSDSASLKGDSQ